MVHLLRVHSVVCGWAAAAVCAALRGSCVAAAWRGVDTAAVMNYSGHAAHQSLLCMVQANWPSRCTGALRHYRRRRCHAVSRRRQTNAATNTPPPPRLCWSVLVHTSDQRSHADFPSLPDASSHSSFIFFFDFTFTHIPIAIPQYIYLEQ